MLVEFSNHTKKIPVPVISAAVTASPLIVVNGCALPPSEVNRTGSVPVVPVGIACAKLIIMRPLNGAPTFLWLLKSNRTSVAVTVTPRLRNAGIPFTFTFMNVGNNVLMSLFFKKFYLSLCLEIGKSCRLTDKGFANALLHSFLSLASLKSLAYDKSRIY